jgi:copper oxidase (laccase) domain-containing protein
MVHEFGCHHRDIQVLFSPSLGINHSAFINYQSEFPADLWHYRNHQGHVDLKKMAVDEIIRNGIPWQNIKSNPSCTFEEETKFYSYRKTKTLRRHISYIFLNGEQ